MSTTEIRLIMLRIRPERGACGDDLRALVRELHVEMLPVLALLYDIGHRSPLSLRVSELDLSHLRQRLNNRYCPFHEDLSAVHAVYSD